MLLENRQTTIRERELRRDAEKKEIIIPSKKFSKNKETVKKRQKERKRKQANPWVYSQMKQITPNIRGIFLKKIHSKIWKKENVKVNLYKNLKKLQMKKDNCLLVNKEKKEIVEAAN